MDTKSGNVFYKVSRNVAGRCTFADAASPQTNKFPIYAASAQPSNFTTAGMCNSELSSYRD